MPRRCIRSGRCGLLAAGFVLALSALALAAPPAGRPSGTPPARDAQRAVAAYRAMQRTFAVPCTHIIGEREALASAGAAATTG